MTRFKTPRAIFDGQASPRIPVFSSKTPLLLGTLGLCLALNPRLVLAQTTDSPAVVPPATTDLTTSAATNASGTNTANGAATSGTTTSTSAAVQARRAMRTPRVGDYVAALGGLALVLSAKRHPASNSIKNIEGDQQFSVISPFPGGGYSVLPDGQFRPGGAMQVNIPIAYVPTRFSGAVSVDVAQNRGYQTLSTENGRNGTATLGLGFPVAGRGVWVSRMFLSAYSFTHGGDRAYCAVVQLAPETRSVPAIAIGVQDATNSRIRSPFIVATKQLGDKPVFATFGLGRGRFSGSSVLGGLSYSPIQRLSLAAEYDGLQFNVGAGYALSQRLSLLVSYDDLAANANRPTGRLGRRYQFGANFTF